MVLRATCGDAVACRATAVLLGCGVAAGVGEDAPGLVVGWACVFATATCWVACRWTGCVVGAFAAGAGDGCVSRRANGVGVVCCATAGEGVSTGVVRWTTVSVV